jgi:hypothetical protein
MLSDPEKRVLFVPKIISLGSVPGQKEGKARENTSTI